MTATDSTFYQGIIDSQGLKNRSIVTSDIRTTVSTGIPVLHVTTSETFVTSSQCEQLRKKCAEKIIRNDDTGSIGNTTLLGNRRISDETKTTTISETASSSNSSDTNGVKFLSDSTNNGFYQKRIISALSDAFNSDAAIDDSLRTSPATEVAAVRTEDSQSSIQVSPTTQSPTKTSSFCKCNIDNSCSISNLAPLMPPMCTAMEGDGMIRVSRSDVNRVDSISPILKFQCREEEWNQIKDLYDCLVINQHDNDDRTGAAITEQKEFKHSTSTDAIKGEIRVLLLKGESGSGKRTLLQQLKNYHTITHQQPICIEIQYKSHQTARTILYASLWQCLYHYIGGSHLDSKSRAKIVYKLQQALDDEEKDVIIHDVPHFRQYLFNENNTDVLRSSCVQQQVSCKPSQLKIISKKLFQAVFESFCQNDHNVLFPHIKKFMFLVILHDVQWVPEIDMDMFNLLATFPTPYKFLIATTRALATTAATSNIDTRRESVNRVFGYDSNKALQALQKTTLTIYVEPLTSIQVTNIIRNNFIVTTSSSNIIDETTRIERIVSKIHGQTNFNFLLLTRWIQLHAKWKQIASDSITGEVLALDCDEIINDCTNKDCKIPGTDNVILAAFFTLTDECQDHLQMASCLGWNVDKVLLEYAVPYEIVHSSLVEASCQHFIKLDLNTAEWDFTHAKIRDDVYYNTMDETERMSRHYRLGKRLWRNLDVDKLAQFIFPVVDNLILCESISTCREERIGIARLCLSAGERAAQISSFDTARYYFVNGISLLDADTSNHCWRDEYDLTLSLYSGAAECSYSSGCIDEVTQYHNMVVSHARLYSDTVRARMMMLNSIGSQGNVRAAVDYGIDMLYKLGEKFPRKPRLPNVVLEMMKLKIKMKRQNLIPTCNEVDDQCFLRMAQLPTMSDPIKLAVMQVLNLLLPYAMCVDHNLTAFFGIRMMNLTIGYGISGLSCVGIALFADSMCSVGWVNDGYQFGQVAQCVFERFQNRSFLPRFYLTYYLGVHAYKHPVSEWVNQIKYAHLVGLETGDNEFATFAGIVYCILQFDRIPLVDIDSSCQLFSDRARTLKQCSTQQPNECLRHMIQILCKGNKCDSSRDFLENFDKNSKYQKVKTKIPFMYKPMLFSKLIVQYVFGDIDECVKGFKAYRSLPQKEELSPPMTSTLAFIEALAYISQARRKGRLYSCRASQCSYILHTLSRLEPHSHLGRYMLVKAELSDLYSGSNLYGNLNDNIYPKYVAAVASAAKSDSFLTIAISNEVAAKYVVRIERKKYSRPAQDALMYFNDASTAYRHWGAVGKVRDLEQEIQQLGSRI